MILLCAAFTQKFASHEANPHVRTGPSALPFHPISCRFGALALTAAGS